MHCDLTCLPMRSPLPPQVPDSTYDMVGGLDQQIKEIKEVGGAAAAAWSSAAGGEVSLAGPADRGGGRPTQPTRLLPLLLGAHGTGVVQQLSPPQRLSFLTSAACPPPPPPTPAGD